MYFLVGTLVVPFSIFVLLGQGMLNETKAGSNPIKKGATTHKPRMQSVRPRRLSQSQPEVDLILGTKPLQVVLTYPSSRCQVVNRGDNVTRHEAKVSHQAPDEHDRMAM
ncbi:hypothetical protein AMTRI_Chr04g183860 [Amborella trichopoda]|uniref:Secreted protein n=1 Tax=Amborella trichopoda TaxID=13333 RepID=W1NNK3_AMBTC|nr:hypothetical protein AMTR_s00073p00098560 [Amborella trichopoda]